ncbi:MAG: LURP-one-related family protein [Clostridia bacterium]|nr:LURP-one-related family protein [Clostridia bacterium]
MKLYIKQQIFSWRDRFEVKEENGSPKYYVEGEIFSWGKKLHVYDCFQHEVAYIEQRIFSFLPTYDIYVRNRNVARIVKEFTFLRPRYSINTLNWEIDGSFWFHDYSVKENGREIVNISKEWMTWGDSYELDIRDTSRELEALAVVLTIDCVIDQSRN